MRRVFIIAAVIVVFVGVGSIVYFSFFRSSPSVVVAPSGSTSGLPVAGRQAPPSTSSSQEGPFTSSSAGPASVSVSARLVKISSGPVVYGEAVVDQAPGNASSTQSAVVNFIERQSGNIFSYSTQTKTLTRTSNRTVPGIQAALWLPSGSLAFVRYLSGSEFSTINTYALPLAGSGGFFLPQNIIDMAVSSTSVLTLASGVNGSTASVSRVDGTHSSTVFSTPLSSLRVAFLGKSQYLATTKASGLLLGDAFLVDASGRFMRIAGPLAGLATLPSPSGKWLFASYVSDGSPSAELVNTATAETLPLPIATLAEKCVWAADETSLYCGVPNDVPGGTYPDDWYQGAVHFSDRIWKIQVSGRYAQLVLDVSGEAGTAVDVATPTIDRAGSFLVFVNKNDGSLWGYSL